jgi:glutamate/tyrosine decarboxylase-like PLP-dependent enzyme
VHLTRRARGLPFWFSLATHGTQRYADAVEHTLATARAVAAGIEERGHLRLVLGPELSVLLFERPGWDEQRYAAWSRQMALDGVILCLPTRWRERTVLRLAFVNPETQPAQVLAALDTLR